MRLIDADKLIEDIYSNAYACTNDEINKILHKQLETNINVINNQPTAFDVDKVVEQLEELQHYACFPTEWVTEEQQPVYKYFKDELTKILDFIVKAGGIDE